MADIENGNDDSALQDEAGAEFDAEGEPDEHAVGGPTGADESGIEDPVRMTVYVHFKSDSRGGSRISW